MLRSALMPEREIEPAIPDDLEDEFRKLEREVRQRTCPHDRKVDVTEFGASHHSYMCTACGKWFPDGRPVFPSIETW